jgi:hypothetical protein
VITDLDMIASRIVAEGRAEARRGRPALRDLVLTRSQLADLPTPEPLIEDTIDRRTVTLLAGPWGTGKTFLALDWAACVATGRIWQRRRVRATGPVLYVASEGAFGFGSRVDAWEYGWNRNHRVTDEALTVLPVPVNLRDRAAVDELCQLAAGCSLVVIDTLARCLVGADENSAKDMGEAVDALYRLRDATGNGTVLAVHHTGKDGETTRGSSALEAGVDTVYKTKGDARLIALERTKRKDGETADRLQLTLKAIAESCIVASTHGVDMTGSADSLLSTFRTHFADTGASKAELRNVAAMANGSFHRAVNELVRTGALVNTKTPQRPFYVLAEPG